MKTQFRLFSVTILLVLCFLRLGENVIAQIASGVSEDSTYKKAEVLYVTTQNSAIPIAEARAMPEGTAVTVVGTVIVPTNVHYPNNWHTHIQDATGGILIFNLDGIPTTALGQRIEVTGVITTFNCDTEIRPISVTIVGNDELPVPLAKSTGQINEEAEGWLVKVSGEITGFATAGPHQTIDVNDGSGVATILIRQETSIDISSLETGTRGSFVGVAHQYDESGVCDTGYQVTPRYQTDLDIIDPQRPYHITGYVRDHTGAPVPGAIVSSEPWGLAFTDETGYYEMDMLIGGVYMVRAQVGSQSLSPEARVVVLPPSAENQNFTTLPQYGQLSGVVQERGTLQPIQNVRVSLGGDVTFTNEEGEYLLTQVLPGMHTLRVFASGYESYEIVGFNVAENDMLTKDVLLQSIQSQNYYLPYPGGVSYKCIQGVYGDFSHQEGSTWQYAFDFDMKNGDPVVAALEGRIVKVEEGFTEEQSCGNSACIDFTNHVRIRHADGSDTLYFHLNHNSVIVDEGDFVQRGEKIAESDNTGWTTSPHLDITRHKWGGWNSIPLAFADVSGDGIPQAGTTVYTSSNYPQTTTSTRDLILDDVPPRVSVELILTGIPTYTLSLRAFGYLSDVTEMKLARSDLGLEIASWSPYTTSAVWRYPVVYAQFRDGNGNLSEVVSDTVDAVGYETINASFAISPTVCVNSPITLTNQTTPFCEGCNWQWDFGNGVSSRGADPQFDFSGQSSFYGYWLPDVYTVTLSVSNAFTTTFFSRTVQALPQPSAGFTLIQDGHTITVTAENMDAASWYWTFGDGASANGRVATHTYTGATSLETYTVRLTVESHQGCTNSSYQSPSNPPIALEIDGPKAGLIGESFTFTATANVTATLPLTYVWNFGDEPIITHTGGISDAAVFSWTIPGPKTVMVTATNAGGTITATHSVTLYTPVQANFMANPTAGTVPLTVVFTNTSTGDYDSSLWDFGDGTSNTIQLPIYKYTKAGTYTVTLTVSGPGGSDMEIKTDYITVTEAPDDHYYVYLPLVLRSQTSVKTATKPLQVTSKRQTQKLYSR